MIRIHMVPLQRQLVRTLWITVFSGCAAIPGPTTPSPERHEPRPDDPAPVLDTNTNTDTAAPALNILWIVADDLGTDKVSAYAEHPLAPHTPSIDALADRGMLFRNAYAYGTCSPSRAAMLTGRYGRRTGIGGIVHALTGEVELPLSEETLPEVLASAPIPYESRAVGKWHLSGYQTPSGTAHPNLQGFADYRGSIGNLGRSTTDEVFDYFHFEKIINGQVEVVDTYATTDTTNDALHALETLEPPWFLYVAYNAPHEPRHVPPAELYPGELTEDASPVAKYNAAVQAMDHELGRLLAGMSVEQRDSTLVVFLGDNGTPTDAVEAPRDPQEAKGTLYEGGTNVPLILSGPGVAPGQEAQALVHVVDLFTTAAALAGAHPSAPLDGLDLTEVLLDSSQAGPRQLVYTEMMSPVGYGPYDKDRVALRDSRYKVMEQRGAQPGWKFFDLQGLDVDGVSRHAWELSGEEQEIFESLRAQAKGQRESLAAPD